MENNRMGVPPGVGPKLPEQPYQPAESGPKAGSRRENLIIGVAAVLLVALAIWFIVFAMQAGKTPQQVVDAFTDETLQVQEELVMASLPGTGQRYVYFYIAGDRLACAILQNRASGFKVMDATGGLALTGGERQGIWKMFSPKGSTNSYFVFGLLYDDALTGVKVNGADAVVIDTGVYRCWYYYSEDLSIDSESVVYL